MEREAWEAVLPWMPAADIAAVSATCRHLRCLCAAVTAARAADATRGLERRPIPFRGRHFLSPPYASFLYSPFSLIGAAAAPLPFSRPWPDLPPAAPPSPFSALPHAGPGCRCLSCAPKHDDDDDNDNVYDDDDGYDDDGGGANYSHGHDGDVDGIDGDGEGAGVDGNVDVDIDGDVDGVDGVDGDGHGNVDGDGDDGDDDDDGGGDDGDSDDGDGDDVDCPCGLLGRGDLITECGPGCDCGPSCPQRRSQGGVSVVLEIGWTPRKGWGLFASEPIQDGAFVCEYAGEYLTTTEARQRQKRYDEQAVAPALLVLREHLPSGRACLRVNVDATVTGNVARFINHDCGGGNLAAILVRCTGLMLPRVCFFACRDIAAGEELRFSYGEAEGQQTGRPCFCGSPVCRGVLPSEET
ncbi:uncharacterized protein LOC144711634 [Wolffia australiana]